MGRLGIIIVTSVTAICSFISVVLVKRKSNKNSIVTAAGKIN